MKLTLFLQRILECYPIGLLARRLDQGMFQGPSGKVWFHTDLGMRSLHSETGRRICQACSTWLEIQEDGTSRVSHNIHEETRLVDDILRLLGVLETYCAPCNKTHSLRVEYHGVLHLFITTSSLAGFEGLDCGDTHRETISISGAKIRFLANRFRVTYARTPLRLIVLIFGGLNDAVSQEPVAQFRNHLQTFSQMIEDHGATHGVKNKLHFSSLYEPPCMRNKPIQMATYNGVIDEVNSQNPGNFFSPDMRGRFRGKGAARKATWRERQPAKQLHLKDAPRQELYRELMGTFLTQKAAELPAQDPEGDENVLLTFDSRAHMNLKRKQKKALRLQRLEEAEAPKTLEKQEKKALKAQLQTEPEVLDQLGQEQGAEEIPPQGSGTSGILTLENDA